MQALSKTAGGVLRGARSAPRLRANAAWHKPSPPKHTVRLTALRRFSDDSKQEAAKQKGSSTSAATQLEQLSSRLEAVERECATLRSQLTQHDGRSQPPRASSSSSSGSSSSGSSSGSSNGKGASSKGKPRNAKEHEEQHGTDAASSDHAKEENKPKIASEEQTPEAETENKLRSIHPKIVAWLNAGHLESQRRVTEALMKQEWEGEVRPWAARKGVADLEKHLAEQAAEQQEEGKGGQGQAAGWGALSKLYALLDAPSDKDLEELIKDERQRMLARAFITEALFTQRQELYKRSSEQAKTLADLMESGQSSGLGALWSGIKALLPIPGFLKK